MNREELHKISNELIQAARSNYVVRVVELIGDVFEGGRVAGIEDAANRLVELAVSPEYSRRETTSLASEIRALLEAK